MDAGTPATSAARRAAVRWDRPGTGPHHRVRSVVDAVLLVVSMLVALTLFALAAALTVVPAVVGGHAFTVLSGSMAPTLPPGSIAVDRPVDPATLRIGDVIIYTAADPVTGEPNTVTHRVVAIGHDALGPLFTTRGDANDVADEVPVRADQVHGVLWYDVPFVGYVRSTLRSRGLLMVVGGLALLLAGGWLLRWSGWPANSRWAARGRDRR